MEDWTEVNGGWATEASTLGIPAGQEPTLWGAMWNAEFSNGELVSWYRYQNGSRYTIFND